MGSTGYMLSVFSTPYRKFRTCGDLWGLWACCAVSNGVSELRKPGLAAGL